MFINNILSNNLSILKEKAYYTFKTFRCLANSVSSSKSEPEVHSCSDSALCVIVGVHTNENQTAAVFTKTAEMLDEAVSNRLNRGLRRMPPIPGLGEYRIFNEIHPLYSTIVLVGLGEQCKGYNIREQIDERKEAIRIAVGTGVRALQQQEISKIFVESFGHAESAAEGSSLAAWMYQEFKTVTKRKVIPKLELLECDDITGWQIGLHKAAAQNLARHLQEAPANHLTPQAFAQTSIEVLSKYNINVEVRMQHWAKLRNLNAFLAASQGACNPIFLEIFYEGCDPKVCPVVIIGKGVTFNSGGMCQKSCKQQKYMRGDMAGAACVIATMRAIAALHLPVNVRGLIPLCSNVIGARAMKPGDVIKAHNGKTIRIDCTGCEGLLMHADTLSYAAEYNPKFILDVGTLTFDSYGAMGEAASLVFTNNDSLYEMMRIASIHTGDRIWRLPLWDYFGDYMVSEICDFHNRTPKMIGGGACKAAAFLREFIPPQCDWIHLDTQNIYRTNGRDCTYLRRGMSGRPTRNLIEFLAQVTCNSFR